MSPGPRCPGRPGQASVWLGVPPGALAWQLVRGAEAPGLHLLGLLPSGRVFSPWAKGEAWAPWPLPNSASPRPAWSPAGWWASGGRAGLATGSPQRGPAKPKAHSGDEDVQSGQRRLEGDPRVGLQVAGRQAGSGGAEGRREGFPEADGHRETHGKDLPVGSAHSCPSPAPTGSVSPNETGSLPSSGFSAVQPRGGPQGPETLDTEQLRRPVLG